jgi:hypothetical protein
VSVCRLAGADYVHLRDDLPTLLSDERGPDKAAFPQGIDEASFVVLVEGESVDVPDGFLVGGPS